MNHSILVLITSDETTETLMKEIISNLESVANDLEISVASVISLVDADKSVQENLKESQLMFEL